MVLPILGLPGPTVKRGGRQTAVRAVPTGKCKIYHSATIISGAANT